MNNPIHGLHQLGQSVWYDNIERRLLEDGALAELIANGEIRGITSNPAIFHNAIAKSHDYDAALATMAYAGYSAEKIYEQLTQEDIRAAADLFLPLYESTSGGDGYVSLEVSPALAHDTQGTVAEALRLWKSIDRRNLMIKIPATNAGLPAIRQVIASGVNVNVTLIFSLARYQEVMEAYLQGLEDRLAQGLEIAQVASVASFFVSRIDTKVDKLLEAIIAKEGPQAEAAARLRGKAAIASAALAYQLFLNVFNRERFTSLKEKGGRIQRPLWASTSTKNPAYPDTLYVDELIAPNTINTMPPQTLDAFRLHGRAQLSLAEKQLEAQQCFDSLAQLGISMEQVTEELEREGVQAFLQAYHALLNTIEERRSHFQRELGGLTTPVANRVQELDRERVLPRLHAGDPLLWTSDVAQHEEIRNRLGWIDLPISSMSLIAEIEKLRDELVYNGYTHTLLLGMGGSSLAPEVFRQVFGKPQPGKGLDLRVLDSTDPAQVRAAVNWAPANRTLYIVSSKSGGTAEVNAFLDYFWARSQRILGDRAGEQFIAITDPGTSLEKLARQRGFRRTFLADPRVGGRFSALTAFGLVPAVLLGLNGEKMLLRAAWMATQNSAEVPTGRSPGVVLGAIIGQAALQGMDKLTFYADPALRPFGAWLEQLIAESSGKQGKGIVPIEGEPLFPPDDYGNDRLFIYLRQDGTFDRQFDRLRNAGFPAITIPISQKMDIAVEFYRWEVATAVACAILGVNAFDQPDVQDNKTRTLNRIQAYRQTGRLESDEPIWEKEGYQLFSQQSEEIVSSASVTEALKIFLNQAIPGDYVAINAYLPRNPRTISWLQRMRQAIRRKLRPDARLATTVGFGPRFLHSTGQLHKGGSNNGVFIQITAEPLNDLEIPGQGISFGVLQRAQALGDFEALQARGRRVIRLHLAHPGLLKSLIEMLER